MITFWKRATHSVNRLFSLYYVYFWLQGRDFESNYTSSLSLLTCLLNKTADLIAMKSMVKIRMKNNDDDDDDDGDDNDEEMTCNYPAPSLRKHVYVICSNFKGGKNDDF